MTLRQRLSANTLFAAALFAVWYVLSGKADWMHLGVGALAVLAIAAGVPPVVDGTQIRWGRFAGFAPWLLKEIVVSNIHVARIVLSPSCPARPQLVELDPPLSTPRARALFGISAMLTPGSLTIDVDERTMLVHAIDDSSAAGVLDGRMVARVAALFDDGRRP
ncbi:MAG TPA: Na+/H+ antiporter subunit E [Gemmatimonadaceae bacterium]|nr:Na+/H+ antiporter subunit E [Gemmatimonadaceae bacterium]